ncbi:MAG: hypothetical protein E7607_02905 [Ruminococcaceae bacterium]|nr:hypothetical protein [Oscillospiraceae bacterium]
MANTYKIILDTKGGDNGPEVLIKGAAIALKKFDSLSYLMVGDRDLIEKECVSLSMPMDRVEILDAPNEITNYDNPAAALFEKQDSSMIKSLVALDTREDLLGLITTGNTGVLLGGTVRFLNSKERVRPCLAALLPNADGSFTCLVDTGATIDCSPQMLVHFAKQGSRFMKQMYGIESPRVGLLSNGAESTKGNKLVKETHALLAAESEINFIGNVEGNTALSGICDILVCDGFAGNLVLKVSEGMAKRLITDIVKYGKRTGNESIMELVGHLMKVYDFGSLGGGLILGTDKPVIKARGNSNETTVVSVSEMILNMVEHKAIFDKSRIEI